MTRIIVNNIKYKLHPVYDLFGADKKGNMICIITKIPPESNSSGSRIKIRSQNSRHFMYDKLVFICECHNGEKPKDKTVLRVSDTDSNDELVNLQLIDVCKRNEIVMSRWRNTAWKCLDCGFQTTNNASRHHRRVCKYSKSPYTEEEMNKINALRDTWKKQKLICKRCGKQLVNSGKYAHNRICEKKYLKMED